MYEIDWGNPKYTTFTKLVQVRNFITFELKVIRLEERERERHNLSMLTFPSAPNHVRPPLQTTGLASTSPESQPSSSEAGTQLSDFFSNLKILSPHFRAWRHSHPLVLIIIWDFHFDISEWHILSAPTWTPTLMLHLTNSCAKRKVLSLTKPKGKIYKTKSLGSYITDRALSGATTPGQSGPGSDGNEGLLHIPQSSSITGTSPADCLVSYRGHSLGGGIPSAKN